MKPSFALDFRDGVIALLHRTSRGWQQVGATPLDAPDLAEALSYLRATALGLSPRGLATKLVIPNDQVLYTQVHAPGPDVARRRRQIQAGLEGLTPYKVDDLVYDWWGSGPEVHVAVVARETLTEAEGFAAEHRFNPVSFVAAPDSGGFRGEPYFGPSALAASLLAAGEKVERDQEPITVVAREFPRTEGSAAMAEPVARAAEVRSVPEMQKGEIAPSAAVEPAAAPVEAAAGAVVVTGSGAEPGPVSEPEVVVESGSLPTAVTAPEPVVLDAEPVAVEGAVLPGGKDSDALPDFSAARAPAAGVMAFDPNRMAVDLVDEAPMALDVSDEPREQPLPEAASPAEVVAPVTATGAASMTATGTATGGPAGDDLSAGPAASIMAAFASRRTQDQVLTAVRSGTTANFAAAAEAKARKAPALGPAPTQRASVPRPALARPAAALPQVGRDAVLFPGRLQAAKLAPAKARGGVTAAGIAGPKRERVVVPLSKSAAAGATEGMAEGMAGGMAGGQTGMPSGARTAVKGLTGLDGRPLPVRGKPRYLGIILTGLLLLALAVVAAWSSYYLSSNDAIPGATPAENAVASTAPNAAAPETAADLTADPAEALPSAADEALADGQDPDLLADNVMTAAPGPTEPAGSEAGVTQADIASAPEPAAIEPATTAATTAAAAAGLGAESASEPAPEPAAIRAAEPVPEPLPEPAPATGVVSDAAVAVAPGNDPQDEIFLAAADTPPQTFDPVVLPQIAVGNDPPPDLATPPPPFGTVYTFDAEGRIQPTPEGIMTPEGVLLVAGPPKLVPPVRPAALTLVAVAPVATLPDAAAPAVGAPEVAATVAGGPLVPDPALAGKKPKPRPADLVDPAATAERQGGVLAPAPGSRFANARPQRRPGALTVVADAGTTDAVIPDAGTGAANEAAAASLASNGIQSSTSALAVAVSRKPASRPSGMDQAVDAAVAAAVQAPEPEAEQQTASLTPEEQAEPEAETAAPRLPTNASVARQATTKDALNLSRVALLGIFGTASGRYAMVRQPGGSVKRIVVGDTIDGGKVAAITATAVQYKKGGRMLTLSLPQG